MLMDDSKQFFKILYITAIELGGNFGESFIIIERGLTSYCNLRIFH